MCNEVVGAGLRGKELLGLLSETIHLKEGEAPGMHGPQLAGHWYPCCTDKVHERTVWAENGLSMIQYHAKELLYFKRCIDKSSTIKCKTF